MDMIKDAILISKSFEDNRGCFENPSFRYSRIDEGFQEIDEDLDECPPLSPMGDSSKSSQSSANQLAIPIKRFSVRQI